MLRRNQVKLLHRPEVMAVHELHPCVIALCRRWVMIQMRPQLIQTISTCPGDDALAAPGGDSLVISGGDSLVIPSGDPPEMPSEGVPETTGGAADMDLLTIVGDYLATQAIIVRRLQAMVTHSAQKVMLRRVPRGDTPVIAGDNAQAISCDDVPAIPGDLAATTPCDDDPQISGCSRALGS